ncbi:MAG: glycosyltransferase family 2 protein [Lachnospiraceae bacterium]|nr:glycosyltransferase family 2 protein [Lachnospiraceae bacterium]
MSAMVSICIPAYNNPEEVRRLFNSIEAQTLKDCEIILSDDSTDDGIRQLVEEKLDNPFFRERLNYLRNDPAMGPILNWNAALRPASGKYIKIMFSDDWFSGPDSLARFVQLLEQNPEADLAFSGSRQVVLHPETSENLTHLESQADSWDRAASDAFLRELSEDWRRVFTGNEIGAPSAVLFRRTDPPFLFDEKSGFASDVYLYLDILKANPVYACTKEPLICIGIHENQYTETFTERDERIYADYRQLYFKHQLWESDLCRSWFLREMIVPYRKSAGEAQSCHISAQEYRDARRDARRKTIQAFLSYRLGRLFSKDRRSGK